HVLAVAHPHDAALALVEPGEEAAGLLDLDLGAAVLAMAPALHLAAAHVRDPLHAVADAEQRRDVEDRWVEARRPLVGHRARAARENDRRRLPLADPRQRAGRRMD